ncbi:glycosyltransferase family 4 protein [Rhodocyclus tenuis]|uniref:Glycosyltransferase n=2 Tax=Rhodocyclus TaxID=1064 RepID=A0A6L5K080_RHOTE|nr:glycosyltransferase [Rhodocyclus gracilis]MQY52314.1 glycosyltransferase [Rhodocyclus gracilis]MRD73902.1 glycosyltransferase [Rhodocyclus gracilis]NJA89828.1 glycosyltransferase family 4 protein [Rhodocyclus gracilis]
MRVLMVSDVYFPRINGVSTAIQTCREALRAEDIDVQLVAPDYGSADTPGNADHNGDWVQRVPSRVVPRDPEDRLLAWRALRRAVDAAAVGCDLIHIQTPFLAHYAAHGAARRARLPVIATYHTLFEEYLEHYAPFVPQDWLRGLARRFSRTQCNALDAVVVPSHAIHQRLSSYGVKTPLHVLPTGIPLAQFAPLAASPGERSAARSAFRAQHGIDAERPVALYVGRVAFEKNLEFLLDAAALVRESTPDLLLLIAGEGPALAGLREAASARGLDGNVQFLGYLDRQHELPACYAAADAFVFASRTETQGLVLLEAMAAGLPVVALAVMGTVDILGARRGALVPDDNPAAFALELAHLLRDAPLRQRLGSEGRTFASEWSDVALAGRLAGLYRHVVAEHRDQRNHRSRS